MNLYRILGNIKSGNNNIVIFILRVSKYNVSYLTANLFISYINMLFHFHNLFCYNRF